MVVAAEPVTSFTSLLLKSLDVTLMMLH